MSERKWGDPNDLDPEDDFQAWVNRELIVEYEKEFDRQIDRSSDEHGFQVNPRDDPRGND